MQDLQISTSLSNSLLRYAYVYRMMSEYACVFITQDVMSTLTNFLVWSRRNRLFDLALFQHEEDVWIRSNNFKAAHITLVFDIFERDINIEFHFARREAFTEILYATVMTQEGIPVCLYAAKLLSTTHESAEADQGMREELERVRQRTTLPELEVYGCLGGGVLAEVLQGRQGERACVDLRRAGHSQRRPLRGNREGDERAVADVSLAPSGIPAGHGGRDANHTACH